MSAIRRQASRPIVIVVLLATRACTFGASNANTQSDCSGPVILTSDAAWDFGPSTHLPIGPPAHDANEAWPTRPDLPVLMPADLAQACVDWIACSPASDAGPADSILRVSICIGGLGWSAERAIPLSGYFGTKNERVEYFVPCVLQHAGDCAAVLGCASERDPSVTCEEDGCWIYGNALDYHVSCSGTLTHVVMASRSFDRDCALSLAECSVTSRTGCTDRLLTTCEVDASTDDRCDGNVRLGCDRSRQLSYRDCARMGGVCGSTPHGADCIYQDSSDAGACGLGHGSCSGDMLSICVNGKYVSVPARTICAAP